VTRGTEIITDHHPYVSVDVCTVVEGCGSGVVDVGIVDPKGGKLSVPVSE